MPTIKNLSRKRVIAKNAAVCKSVISKAAGLMFSRKKPLIFAFDEEKIVPLHMLFVFYPIDVLFLDRDKVVVEIKERLMPFAFYTPKRKSQYIIEIPVKTIKKTKTRLGDKINF